MSGYIHDPLQIINLIADNIRDRYKTGFSVVKEIIQNADDSKSGDDKTEKISFEFGLSPGLPESEHPLLRSSALFFFNNGRFSPSDAVAIRSFGLNQKAIDKATIGKFGLGMKSVFHFCEAFFFMAHDQGKDYFEILNPWSGPAEFGSLHADWDVFKDRDRDASLLKRHLFDVLGSYQKNGKSWFLLWLPLRSTKHTEKNSKKIGTIVAEFPGDDVSRLSFLRSGRISKRLARLLPLLRRIVSIRYWEFNQKSSFFEPVYRIDMETPDARTKYPKLADNVFKGRILSETGKMGTGSPCVIYSGLEKQIKLENLENLRLSEFWPRSYVRDQNGQSVQAPDKATPHCAAVFSRFDSVDKPSLDIRWAVFLPVDTGRESISVSSQHGYCLTLHGYFFVDAGRTGVSGIESTGSGGNGSIPANEAELRQHWNENLAKHGTLRLVIPALSDFIRLKVISPDDVRSLCQALLNSNIFRQHNDSICKTDLFVLKISPSGIEWKSCHSSTRLLPLPNPPADTQRPWKTFRRLASLEGNSCLIVDGAPHLVSKNTITSWDHSSLEMLLDIDVEAVFKEQSLLSYFRSFLTSDNIKPLLQDETIQKCIVTILRSAFQSKGRELTQYKSIVQEIVSLVFSAYRFHLTSQWSEVTDAMLQAQPRVLIVPKELAPASNLGSETLDVEDAVVLLTKLDELVGKLNAAREFELLDECIQTSGQIIKSVQGSLLNEVFDRVPAARVIGGIDCRKNRRRLFSIRDLNRCREKKVLFLFSQGTNETQRRGLSLYLQQTIQERVILINSNTAQLVFGTHHGLVPCHANSCLASLGTSALLLTRDDARRAALIGECAGISISRTEEIRGMRYLLHGRSEHYHDSQPLWTSGYQQDPVWEKMWRFLPENSQGDWRLLTRNLVEQIPQNRWDALNLREIMPRDILKRFAEVKFSGLDGRDFCGQERDTVLMAAGDDSSIWKSMPFHETLAGDLRNVPEQTAFLESDVELPKELTAKVAIFKLNKNEHVQRYQEKYLSPLTVRDKILILISCYDPSKYWRELMDALQKISSTGESIAEFSQKVRETCWLRNLIGEPVKPCNVIDLEPLQEEVSLMTSANTEAFLDPTKLRESVRQHPFFPTIRESYFSSGDSGLKMLGIMVAQSPYYTIGELDLGPEMILRFLEVMKDVPSEEGFAGWRLIVKTVEYYGIDKCQAYIIRNVARRQSFEKNVAILIWLRLRYDISNKSEKKEVINLFNIYLGEFAKIEMAKSHICKLELLNQVGKWKPASELCAEEENIDENFVLEKNQYKKLAEVIEHQSEQVLPDEKRQLSIRNIEQLSKATARKLRAYFREWTYFVSPELICAFLSLMIDDKEVLGLAQEYQGRRSVDGIRYLLGLDTLFMQSAEKKVFSVQIIKGDSVKVISLLGEEILVPLKSRFHSLIVGRITNRVYDNKNKITYFPLYLKELSADQFSPSDLSMLLKETIVYILTEIYRINAPNIDIAWEELSRSEQLDMQIAQRLIMKHVPLHLRGIGVQKDPLLRREFELWDEARYGMEEFSDNQKKYSEYEGKEKQAIKQIKKLIISEPNVQETILEAIRKKITDFQYSSERIPFEIFQNADDAIAELAFICESTTSQKSSQLSSSAQRFVLRKSDSKITFMHWGRPINHVGSAKFNGRQYGYHQDLEKMLLWSSSDKQSGTDVTGKFGLGFKSIFLASNTPCVVSGRLGFKIVAGLYPDKLDSPSRIRKQLDEETGDERLPGTIIELCLDRPGLNNVCDTFICMAGVLTVFSKKIRKIEVFSNNNKISYEWFGDVVFQPPDSTLEIGTINTFNTTTSKIQNFKGLHFKFNKGGGFLVGVGQRGLTQLPDDLPAIWVVAPTRESIGLGFAVNGNFAVDAGRTRLSGTSQANDVEGKRLGDQLGGCLLTMFEEADREWPLFRKRMHLDVDLEPYEFWNSVWGVMTNGLIGGFDSAVSGIIRNILTEDNGLGRLVKECSALPTGLWTDDYRVLTKTGHVRFVLRGALSQQRVFEKVSRLEIFADNVSPGSAVANNIHDALCKVSPSYARKRDQWQSLTLGQVLLWMENSDFRVSPETAEVLGQIITLELLENLRGTDGGINEAAHLKEVLKRIKFKTRSGNWYSCRNNLVSDSPVKGVGEDELLRAAFAPDDNILDQSYSETGVMFFATCREKLNATAELMNDWIIQAESIPIQRAALTYLLVGELGERLAELIRRRGLHGTWLANLRSSGSIFEGWDQDDINEVLIRRLCSIDKIGVISGGNEGEDLKLDATETLNSISRWWREQGPEEIKKYDSQTYPGGEIPDLHEDYFGRINRNNWLVVFVLGACHTFGLTRRQQHKGFIELCRQKGWWDTFSAEAPETRADQWMSVLDQYIDAQVDVSEYEMWMNRFPAIYRLARDLDAYSEIFLDIGRNSELANLDEITITRANSKYQGGSYSTPPLKRTLGIGACFVVRELKRAGRITSKVATPHCYLPVARIRRLMNLMGCPDLDSNQAYAGQSKIIHRFICEHLGEKEAQFQGAYDIPLQIVMERSDLQRQLIGRVVDQE